MCTCGVVFRKDGTLLAFKNCDVDRHFDLASHPVTIRKNKGLGYIKFGGRRNPGKTGFWAAANEKGVCCLGLDGNGLVNLYGKKYGDISHIMKAYETAIQFGSTAKEAAWTLIENFQKYNEGISDIVIMADPNEAIFIDYSHNEWGLKFLKAPGYDVRTNFFLVLEHLRPASEANPVHMSSAKRFERAIQLISRTSTETSVDDLMALCSDHENGPSPMSICRHGGHGEFNTIGTAIFEISRKIKKVHYTANGNPCETEFQSRTF